MKFVPFPSIEQFRNVIRTVKDRARYAGKDDDGNPIFNNAPLPTLRFKATVKMHGTNAAVSLDREGNIGAQSRSNMLSMLSDNAGWFVYVTKHKAYFKAILSRFMDQDVAQVTMFGEWCGGNIQKGVALCKLDKMFVIFAVRVDLACGETVWVDDSHWYNITDSERRVFNTTMFKEWFIDIDFNNPELVQNELIRITQEVEAECPVGKHFGVSGIGEGIVLTHNRTYAGGAEFYIFKSKGEKHSVSKVKTLNAVDPEKVANVKEFVSNVVTLNRLEQGIQVMKEQQLEPIDKNIGHFIKWVNGDVFKEESDTIAANDLDAKMVSKEVSNAARVWYFQQIA